MSRPIRGLLLFGCLGLGFLGAPRALASASTGLRGPYYTTPGGRRSEVSKAAATIEAPPRARAETYPWTTPARSSGM